MRHKHKLKHSSDKNVIYLTPRCLPFHWLLPLEAVTRASMGPFRLNFNGIAIIPWIKDSVRWVFMLWGWVTCRENIGEERRQIMKHHSKSKHILASNDKYRSSQESKQCVMNSVAIFDSKKCFSVLSFLTKWCIYFHDPNSVTPFKGKMFYAFLPFSMTFRPPSLRVRGPFICYNVEAKNIAKLPINKRHRQSSSWNPYVFQETHSFHLHVCWWLRERVTWIDWTITLDCAASSHLTCTESRARSHLLSSESYFSNLMPIFSHSLFTMCDSIFAFR